MAYNIQMNYYDGSSYQELNPQTTLNQISDWTNSIYSKNEIYSRNEIDDKLNNISIKPKFYSGTYIGNGGSIINISFTDIGIPILINIYTPNTIRINDNRYYALGGISILNDSAQAIFPTGINTVSTSAKPTTDDIFDAFNGNLFRINSLSATSIQFRFSAMSNRIEELYNYNGISYSFVVVGI